MNQDNIQQHLKELSQKLWHVYLLKPEENGAEFILSMLHKDFVLIGTGKHEFYTSSRDFAIGFETDQEQAKNIEFEIIDEWYSCLPLSEDLYIVYGTIWVREKGYQERAIYVEMDTRFTMVFRVTDDQASVLHIHHSVPNFDQSKNEYYPKTMAEQINAAMALAQEFKRKAEKDLLTDIYNRHALEARIETHLASSACGCFYIIDLDDFKRVNDQFGHMKGDEVLVRFAGLLTETFPHDALIGRLGGDEFVVFEPFDQTKAQTEEKANRFLQRCAEDIPCSIGISRAESSSDSFYTLYKQADYALYYAKRNHKGTLSWFEH